MRAYERLLKYVTVRTPSDETSTTVPSSACQFDLAQDLIREFINLGLPKARTDEKCYVYAQIPATPGYENCPKIGFIAHLDTVSDFCDKKIVPVVTENYDGRDLPLGGSDGRVLSVSMFPHLKDLKGRTLITSNGDTILGADDKAGVAEIMTMAEQVLTENIPHGQISIGFTPDEEVGRGADHFDVEKFDADFAYTMDGDTEGIDRLLVDSGLFDMCHGLGNGHCLPDIDVFSRHNTSCTVIRIIEKLIDQIPVRLIDSVQNTIDKISWKFLQQIHCIIHVKVIEQFF